MLFRVAQPVVRSGWPKLVQTLQDVRSTALLSPPDRSQKSVEVGASQRDATVAKLKYAGLVSNVRPDYLSGDEIARLFQNGHQRLGRLQICLRHTLSLLRILVELLKVLILNRYG